jgi:hypothetical protein
MLVLYDMISSMSLDATILDHDLILKIGRIIPICGLPYIDLLQLFTLYGHKKSNLLRQVSVL